jgi:hypothetical protein
MKERSINLNDTYDVIVLGGGPAGCTAATAAAREGAKTLLVEATGCLGGMGTSGLIPAWCPFSDKEKIIYKGLAEKVFSEAKKGMEHVDSDAMDWVPIDPELLKRIYDDMVTGAGADVLFNTTFSAVEMDGNDTVSVIILSNKHGLEAYKAKVFIDCTGDADLAAWAGAEFQKGDDKDGDMQPATHCFVFSNVDEYGYRHGERLHPSNLKSPAYDIAKSEKYNLIEDTHLCNNIIGPGTVGFNAGHLWDVDNTDPISVSKALMKGRKMAAQFRDALAEYHPKAFANAFLVSTGALMGIRETRRIIGDYVITAEDYLEKRSFEDEICRNSYYIDIHHAHKDVEKVKSGRAENEKQCARYAKGESHGLPYRCLTPKGLKNVLVAGRSISCDRLIQGSVRVMPVCLAMGEAVGMAAVHATKLEKVNVHDIDVQYLRKRIVEEGGFIL